MFPKAHVCSLITQEAKAQRPLQVQVQHSLYSKLKSSLGCIAKPCLKRDIDKEVDGEGKQQAGRNEGRKEGKMKGRKEESSTMNTWLQVDNGIQLSFKHFVPEGSSSKKLLRVIINKCKRWLQRMNKVHLSFFCSYSKPFEIFPFLLILKAKVVSQNDLSWQLFLLFQFVFIPFIAFLAFRVAGEK